MNKLTSKILKEISYQTSSYALPPEFLSLMVTSRCNFHCRSCSLWRKKEFQELTEESWKKIAGELSQVLPANTFVEINGGEPLLRKKLIVSLVKDLKKHFSKTTLNSNGLLLDKETIGDLKASGLDVVKLSFYSLDEAIHNDLRGHPLAYQQAKKAIEWLVEEKISLEIGLLITKKNIQGAPALMEYLRTLPKVEIILQPLDEEIESVQSKNKNSNNLIEELWPDPEAVEVFFDYVLKNSQGVKNSPANLRATRQYYLNPAEVLKFRCFAGQRNLIIHPDGEVALCFKGRSIGNIEKQSLKEILARASFERREIKKCQKYCRIIGCNFSRGWKEFIGDKLRN